MTPDAVLGLILGALLTLVGALVRELVVARALDERLRRALRVEVANNAAATAKPPSKNLDPFTPIDRTAWEAARLVGLDEQIAHGVGAAYRLGAKYNALVARTEANIGERPGGLSQARLDALNLLADVNAAFVAAGRALGKSRQTKAP